MPHLEHVSVEGFKKIEELELSPGQFNVVTGRNNSGKTSLLEAIGLGCDPGDLSLFASAPRKIPDLSSRGLPELVQKSRRELSVQIGVDGDEEAITMYRPSEDDARKVLVDVSANLLESEYSGEESLSDALFGEDVTANGDGVVKLQEELTRTIAEVSAHDSLDRISEFFWVIEDDGKRYDILRTPEPVRATVFAFAQDTLDGRLDSKKFDRLSYGSEGNAGYTSAHNLTRNIGPFPTKPPEKRTDYRFVEPQSAGVVTDDRDPVREDDIGDFLREKEILDNLKSFSLDHLVFDPEDEEKYSVPFDQMGEGFKAIVGILWELLDDDLPEVVFLEEPDTHMHPGYVRELVYFLIDLAREEDIQLFVTTHNNDFLNDLFTENLTEEEVEFLEEEFRLIQMQDGAADVMDYREAEHTLEELMLDLRGL